MYVMFNTCIVGDAFCIILQSGYVHLSADMPYIHQDMYIRANCWTLEGAEPSAGFIQGP
jgi:hypothetical protein